MDMDGGNVCNFRILDSPLFFVCKQKLYNRIAFAIFEFEFNLFLYRIDNTLLVTRVSWQSCRVASLSFVLFLFLFWFYFAFL